MGQKRKWRWVESTCACFRGQRRSWDVVRDDDGGGYDDDGRAVLDVDVLPNMVRLHQECTRVCVRLWVIFVVSLVTSFFISTHVVHGSRMASAICPHDGSRMAA